MQVNRQIELGANNQPLDKPDVTLGDRIEQRRLLIGISQAELARRVGVRQSTMNSLIKGDSRSSRSIVAIARELKTTPAYLSGETDDPDENAPLVRPAPPVQYVMLAVALPPERALARMFSALLSGIDQSASLDEQALLLAQRLPIGLSQLRDLLPAATSAPEARLARVESLEAHATPHREP